MYYQNEPVTCEQFLDYLDQLPWCKQGDSVLITVHQCTPAIIEVIKHRDVKVFPGHMIIKLTKSVLRMLENKFLEKRPNPTASGLEGRRYRNILSHPQKR